MALDFQRARPLLQTGNLTKLFIEELGWEPCRQKLTLRVAEADFTLTGIAEKKGFTAWLCASPDGRLPDHATRLKLDRALTQTSFEHLIVFTTKDYAQQSWLWVRRESGRPLSARTHEFNRAQPGDSLLQKLQLLYVSLEEEEAGLSVTEIAGRARAAFDIERVTKAFYRDFDTHRKAFLKFIDGIGEVADREWYASVMLNRLMFVYFIQRKGFLDGDHDYLRNRLDRCQKEQGKDKFYSFYRYFLLRLFHEGFGKRRKDRAPDLEKLLGNIPYLNGGLFDVHELEKPERYGKVIQIPDKAFERIFDYFDRYQWHLDERPLRKDDEINPDVLGYIFEKYINQKQMGAYYTKEDITEYISKSCVIPFLFDAASAKCKVAFENPNGPTVWDLLRENPDRYIYEAVKKGVELPLPKDIEAGVKNVAKRGIWNKPASGEFALPTETWREVVARRQRYQEVRGKLIGGEVREINDFITLNLDLRQFAQDMIINSEGPDLLRAVWHSIEKVTVLDPTCGSGAFLFAALNILEPLYEICLDRMEAFIMDEERIRPKSPEESVRELIASGESVALEFKSTARWNVKESKGDKAMEQVIIKTVAALLNSHGGDLLIGVQDDGSIFGIEADLKLFSVEKRNRDAYENWLMTQLLGAYGKNHAANIRVTFVRLDGKDVCRVHVLPSSTAVYVSENNQDALYVRTGNSTRILSTSEAISYHQQRFTNFIPPAPVAEPSKSPNPKKYADFRKVIEMVAAHPKRRYFIYKSIILNNLFGVDIMEEAVEICKLRLFLKLAAQVDPDSGRENLGIEPLPDIDFNIRAGNSLVGYATYDEVKRAVTSALDFDNAMEKIAVKAADLQQTFNKFRQLQTEGDGSVPHADKLELQKRLKVLEDELNRHLAGEYGVKLTDKTAYARWLTSHQPFHWFVQFYGILTSGGFDVIIGNPPYLEIREVDYALKNYACLDSGAIHAMCMERSARLLHKRGCMSMIVPLSLPSTQRMQVVQDLLEANRNAWYANYAWRPAKLFDTVNRALTVFVVTPSANGHTFSTNYQKWTSDDRDGLFERLNYVEVMRKRPACWIPKIGDPLEREIVAKCLAVKTAVKHFTGKSEHRVYYRTTGGLYWKVFTDFAPAFTLNGKKGHSSRETWFTLGKKEHLKPIIAALSSDIFWWWYTVTSNVRDLNPFDVQNFPMPESALTDAALRDLGQRYLKDLNRNSTMLVREQKQTGTTETQSFKIQKSKPIIDEIDTALAKHYGFTPEELDFIINYDIKYRLGRDTEEEP